MFNAANIGTTQDLYVSDISGLRSMDRTGLLTPGRIHIGRDTCLGCLPQDLSPFQTCFVVQIGPTIFDFTTMQSRGR